MEGARKVMEGARHGRSRKAMDGSRRDIEVLDCELHGGFPAKEALGLALAPRGELLRRRAHLGRREGAVEGTSRSAEIGAVIGDHGRSWESAPWLPRGSLVH